MSFWEDLGDFVNWGSASRQRSFESAEAEKARQFSNQEAEIARQFSSAEALAQREFSSLEAQKVREWETEMSNSAHQREVADLKAAGLNPILAANNGASTPTANSAQGVAAGTTTAQTSKANGDISNGGLAQLVNSASSLITAMKSNKSGATDAIKTIATLAQFLA